MNKPNRTNGLIQRWFARPEPSGDDAADYGTCMGLDLSLTPPQAPPAAETERARKGWTRHLRLRARISP